MYGKPGFADRRHHGATHLPDRDHPGAIGRAQRPS